MKEDNKRTRIEIRCTEDEKSRIEKSAGKENTTVSAYMLSCALENGERHSFAMVQKVVQMTTQVNELCRLIDKSTDKELKIKAKKLLGGGN